MPIFLSLKSLVWRAHENKNKMEALYFSKKKMEALLASYGDSSSDSDTERGNPSNSGINSSSSQPETTNLPLPPPPLSLVNPPNSLGKYNISSINGSLSILIYAHQLFAVLPTKGSIDHHLPTGQPSRVRNFPHVEGNYALHVYIPGESTSLL